MKIELELDDNFIEENIIDFIVSYANIHDTPIDSIKVIEDALNSADQEYNFSILYNRTPQSITDEEIEYIQEAGENTEQIADIKEWAITARTRFAMIDKLKNDPLFRPVI